MLVLQVLFKWNLAWAELYNYLIQPFLDSRELAFNKLWEAKAGLENMSLGNRRKAEYQAMFSDWRNEYNHVLDSIQELYLQYYERTVTILSGRNYVNDFVQLECWLFACYVLYAIVIL